MAVSMQYDMFEKVDDLSEVKKQIEATQKECGNVRRGLFARHNELANMVLKLIARCDALENQIQIVAKNKS